MYKFYYLFFILINILCLPASADNIAKTQKILSDLGFETGPIDGKYGQKTKNALEQFYNNKGQSFDGILSQNEFHDLNSTIKKNSEQLNSNTAMRYNFNVGKGAPFCNDPQGKCAKWKANASLECKENFKFGSGHKSVESRLKYQHCNEEMNFKKFISHKFLRTKKNSPTVNENKNQKRLVTKNWDKETNIKPKIRATEDVPKIIVDAVQKGLEISINKLGNYGPLKVFIVGNDISLVEPIIKDFCKWSKKSEDYNECSKDQGEGMREMAYVYPGGNGFADHGWYLDDPVQTFVHNPSSDERNEFLALENRHELFIDAHVAAHEYFHVYQAAHRVFREYDNDNSTYRLPRWMEESHAEYFAWTIGNQNNWLNKNERIVDLVYSVANFKHRIPGMSIVDIERESGTQRVKHYCGEICIGILQYEYALIATILLAKRTSDEALFIDFYKTYKISGWIKSFEKTFKMPVDDFYTELEVFLTQPINQQIQLLTK